MLGIHTHRVRILFADCPDDNWHRLNKVFQDSDCRSSTELLGKSVTTSVGRIQQGLRSFHRSVAHGLLEQASDDPIAENRETECFEQRRSLRRRIVLSLWREVKLKG